VSTPAPLAAVEAVLTAHLGRSPARASMSFVGVDPVEVLRYEAGPGTWTFASLGMSRQPMSAPSAPALASDGPRAELILRVRDRSDRDGDVWRRVALLAAAPAVEGVVYASGMTIDLGEPLVTGSRCTGAVIAESSIADVATAVGPVAILEVLPATSTELAWSRVNGAGALRGRWHQRGTDLLDLHRPAVALD
jgi:hypothetical protein